MICGRNPTRLHRAQEELDSTRCLTRCCDVTNQAMVAKVVEETVAELGGLDAVVNCAGAPGAAISLQNMTDEEWDGVLDVNLRGSLNTLRASIRHLAKRRGSVTNVSSVNAFQSEPLMAAYGVAKAGLLALTRYAACELASEGIRVNAVAPGWIDTPMSQPALREMGLLGRELDCNMLRRVGLPAEVAKVIVFLAGPDASFVTGATITVDGGQVPLMTQPTRWAGVG
jgi:meso-butanediol dehydrogenase/(S,S)-butanediol dehydrogenase/diacetyl reductase